MPSARGGSAGFFNRARSGPEHGASFKNVAEQTKYSGSIRSHDSYLKRSVKNIYIHIMDSGNSSNDSQCIFRPFTPEKGRHNTRGAFGRLEKTSKIKKRTEESLSKRCGYMASNRSRC